MCTSKQKYNLKISTRQERINATPSRWVKSAVANAGELTFDIKQTHRRLLSLGDNPSGREVAKILGSDLWFERECYLCNEKEDVVVEVGDYFFCQKCATDSILVAAHEQDSKKAASDGLQIIYQPLITFDALADPAIKGRLQDDSNQDWYEITEGDQTMQTEVGKRFEWKEVVELCSKGKVSVLIMDENYTPTAMAAIARHGYRSEPGDYIGETIFVLTEEEEPC